MTAWNPNFELRQLRQFVTVAETRSFRAASEELFISQPALSAAIQKLEAALDVTLFNRTALGVSLTEAGKAFLADARRTLAYAEHGRSNARLAALGEWGSVRLGFVGSASYELLPKRLPPFLARYPSLRPEMIEGTTVSILDMLRDGRMDVGIIGTSSGPTDDLELMPAQSADLVAVLPAEHPLAKHRKIDLAALRDESFVMFASRHVPGLRSVIVNVCREVGFTPRVTLEAVQIQTLVSMVGTGLFVCLVPSMAATISTAAVRFVKLSNPNARSRIQYSVARRMAETSLSAIRLADHLAG